MIDKWWAVTKRIVIKQSSNNGEILTCPGHSRAALLDSLHRSSGCAVLENDPQLGETLVQLQQGGKEALFRRQDGHIARGWDFAMQVEDHILTLHLSEDGIELGVVDHARRGVGSHTGRVTLDTSDASLLGLNDRLRGHGLMEIQRHEIVHIGLDGLQALLVLKRTVNGSHRRDQVRLVDNIQGYYVVPISKQQYKG